MKKIEQISWSIGSLFIHIGMLIVNVLANSIPIGGKTTGQLSAMYPTLFTPAGITFSIWGLIYTLTTIFAIVVLVSAIENKDTTYVASRQFYLIWIGSCIFNGSWIVFWHLERIGIALIIIVLLLVSLGRLVWMMKDSNMYGAKTIFSIYFGWVTVATIANATIYLVFISWSAWNISFSLWLILLLGIGAIIALLVANTIKSLAYIGVFIWAYFGIFLARLNDSSIEVGRTFYLITLLFWMVVFGIYVAKGIYSIVRLKKRALS